LPAPPPLLPSFPHAPPPQPPLSSLSLHALSPSSLSALPHLERVDQGLARLDVLAVVVVDHVEEARRDDGRVGRVAPGNLHAVLLQAGVLGEGGLGALLGLVREGR